MEAAGSELEGELSEAAGPGALLTPIRVPRAGALERPRGVRGGGRRPDRVVDAAGQGAARLGDRAERGAERLEPALLQVVRGRPAQRVLQLRRPPRRGRQRRPGRLPLARRGGGDARRHLRGPAPRRPALRQRAEGHAGSRARRRRRDLHADDPRGRGRDAGLRPHRGSAQPRLRRLLGRLGPRADGVLRGEGTDHGRWRPAQGQDGPDQVRGRRRPRRCRSRWRRSSSSATRRPTAR